MTENEKDYSSALRYPHDLLVTHGLLGMLLRVNNALPKQFKILKSLEGLFIFNDKTLRKFQSYLDGAFDRKVGIKTVGIIPVDHLTVESNDTKESIWYQAMSVKVFNQIIDSLKINYQEYEFVDFGSGKGRVLILAVLKGFKKVTGVEFASDLCQAAEENLTMFKKQSQNPVKSEIICKDAQAYEIPATPVVLFFFSPFKGNIVQNVVNNIIKSYQKNKNTIIIIFYGHNRDSIKIFMDSGFENKELTVSADWRQFTKYRAFIFASENLASLI